MGLPPLLKWRGVGEAEPMAVRVEIFGLFVDPGSGSSIVLLGEANEVTKVVPIFIGSAEARAIALGMQGVTPLRPGTHDLTANVIDLLDAKLERVTVTALRGGTFLAELELLTPNGVERLSTRPSDGIALAVRLGVEVCVEKSVLDEAGIEIEHETDQPFEDAEIEEIVSEFQEFLATAEPSDFDI